MDSQAMTSSVCERPSTSTPSPPPTHTQECLGLGLGVVLGGCPLESCPLPVTLAAVGLQTHLWIHPWDQTVGEFPH